MLIKFPLKCVVIDDDHTSLEILKKMVGQVPFLSAKYFDDPLKALKTIEKEGCNFLVTDVQMPAMSGVELITKLHSLGCGAFVAVITGTSSLLAAYDCLRVGANAFIRKPIQEVEIQLAADAAKGYFESWNSVFKEITTDNKGQ
jgi:FixJ family two-component response regulator